MANRCAKLKNPGQAVVLPITDRSLSQLQSVLHWGLTSCQNSVISPLGDNSPLDGSFPSFSLRFLEKFQPLGVHCLNRQPRGRGTNVSLEYLHSFCGSNFIQATKKKASRIVCKLHGPVCFLVLTPPWIAPTTAA